MNFINKIIFRFSGFEKRAKLLRKSGVLIGKNSEIYADVNFGSEPYLVELGDNVRITSGCKLITHDGGVWVLRNLKKLENADLFGKIKIGNNVHIGMNSIIMPNVNIGENCIIGCGAIVTKDIPNNSVAVGVPARVIENIDTYYEKNKNRCDFTKKLNKKEKETYLMKKYRKC